MLEPGAEPVTLTIAEQRTEIAASSAIDAVAAILGEATVVHSAGDVIGVPTVMVDDRLPVVLAFLAPAVCRALARQSPVDRAFERLFGDSHVAREIYGGQLDQVGPRLARLHGADEFPARRGMAWGPPGDAPRTR